MGYFRYLCTVRISDLFGKAKNDISLRPLFIFLKCDFWNSFGHTFWKAVHVCYCVDGKPKHFGANYRFFILLSHLLFIEFVRRKTINRFVVREKKLYCIIFIEAKGESIPISFMGDMQAKCI